MADKVNMVRPDGSILQVNPEDAGKLGVLGYREEGADERSDRAREEGRQNYYTTTGQKVGTFFEGAANSLTLGGSDYLFGDDDTKARAQYNPGTRMGGEILGALVPLAFGDGAGLAGLGEEAAEGGSLAKTAASAGRTLVGNSPAGLLTKGSEAIFGTGGGLLKTAARTGFEGAVYGGAGAADHAWLSGDPLTAEAVLHGVGFGAIFGAGVGAAGYGLEKVGDKIAESVAARGAEIEGSGVAEQMAKTGETAFSDLHAEVKNMAEVVKASVKQADDVVRTGLAKINSGGSLLLQSAEEGGLSSEVEIATAKKAMAREYKNAATAILDGNPAKAESAMARYQEKMVGISRDLGLSGLKDDSIATLKEISSLRALGAESDRFPTSFEEFKALKPERANRVFAALESAKGLKIAPEVGDAVNGAVEKFTSAMGAEPNGVTGLRDTWATLRRAPAKTIAAAADESRPGITRRVVATVAGVKAGSEVRKLTGSSILGLGAYRGVKSLLGAGNLASGLLGTVGATLGKVRAAAAAYLPVAGRAVQAVAPLGQPLATKLDGTFDNSTKVPHELALRRINEIQSAAPAMKDTLYRAINPLAATQPQLAPALHQVAVTAFSALQALVPKDPGAVSGLKPLWKPDPTQTVILEKQLAVFHDPVAAVQNMLKTGSFDPTTVEALKEFAPQCYQQLRVEMLSSLGDNDKVSKMDYGDQIALSAILDFPIHSSMAPQFIASQQQIFTERSQKNATPQITQQGQSGGGRPGGVANDRNSTASQRITEH